MADSIQNGREHETAFEAYGVRVAVDASEREVLERVMSFLPPGSQPCPPDAVECRFSLVRNQAGAYALERNGKRLVGSKNLELDLALEVLDSQIRIYLGRTAPDAIFIHAGAVVHQGVAIVIPGVSFAGKTTLVAALLRAGAVYYSDEFAVIDRDGRVNAYPKALSVRPDNGLMQVHHAVNGQKGAVGDEPVPLGMIAITTYRPGAEWNPKRLSQGAGAMALLANAVPARERSAEVMKAVSRAAEEAVVIESERGEADDVAPLLLQELEGHSA